jgi:hypothetical protein
VAKRVQWDFSVTLPALGIQGVASEPPLYAQGSHADIYANPTNPTTLVKVTDDQQDAHNTIAAQALASPNVVKCHGHTAKVSSMAPLCSWISCKETALRTARQNSWDSSKGNTALIRVIKPTFGSCVLILSGGQFCKPTIGWGWRNFTS